MSEDEYKQNLLKKKCQKCDAKIGGKAYYLVRLDCLYDGQSVSSCDTVMLCSDCHSKLKSWLNIPPS